MTCPGCKQEFRFLDQHMPHCAKVLAAAKVASRNVNNVEASAPAGPVNDEKLRRKRRGTYGKR